MDRLGLRESPALRVQIGREAAGAQDIDAGKNVRVFHGEPDGSVAPHGVAGETASGGRGHGAVMAVDVSYQIARDVSFPVAGCGGIGKHAALIDGVGVRHHEDHLACAVFSDGLVGYRGQGRVRGQESGLDTGSEPSFIGVGVAVEQVDDRVAPVASCCVARWEVDGDVAIGGIAFEVSFQGFSVNFDSFEGAFRGRLGIECCRG
jgi:hypothetical protein